MTKKDYLIMTGVTILYACLVMFRLGSTSVPQSAWTMDKTEKYSDELVLDLGKETEVSSLYAFLGHMDSRQIAISYYDDVKDEWVVINEEAEADKVYRWDELKVDKKVRYLGIVSRSKETIILEMVILNDKGEKILPINYNNYPELFDEQDLYPEYKSYYYNTMFDEVHYSRSAYELLNGMLMAEYTHPPMGKIIMALGLLLFGVTPLGWRFSVAICGILIVPLIYLLARKITDKTYYALIATVICCLDFMHLTLARVGTIDSIVALFIVAMFTVMFYLLDSIKNDIEKNESKWSKRTWTFVLLGSLSTGMAVATKWTGMYAAIGEAILFVGFMIFYIVTIKNKKDITKRLWMLFVITGASYLLITALVYCVSFLPETIITGEKLLKTVVNDTKIMFGFHSNIVFDHPYESAWYTWAFDWMPLVDAVEKLPDEKVSLVITLGNPIIWWGGLVAVIYQGYLTVKKKDLKALFLVIAYLSMYVPWIFISRTVFIYQYFVCSILLSVILSKTFVDIDKKKTNASFWFVDVCLVVFIIFWPILTGSAVNVSTVQVFMQWLEPWHWLK